MPRPATLSVAPTAEKIDAQLEQASTCLNALSAALESEAWDEAQDMEQKLTTMLGTIRDSMQWLLKEHEAGRPGLHQIFGDDGVRLANVRAFLEATQEAGAGGRNEQAACFEVLEALEYLLFPEDDGLDEGTREELPELPELPADGDQGLPQQGGEDHYPAAGSRISEPGAQHGEEDQMPPLEGAHPDGEVAGGDQIPRNATPPPDVADMPFDNFNAPVCGREMREEQLLENGAKYTGEWRDGMRDGEGVEVRPDGSRFMGQFVMGMAHGKGIYTQSDGLTISGRWYDGKLNGPGIESHPDGTTYEGQYKEGVKSGFGTYTYEEGSVYEGEFNNDRMDGNGVYVSANGNHGGRYQGQWARNRMHGAGLFKVPDGRKYDGEYYEDRRNGSGTFSWPDGRVHEGQWKCGKMHGAGKALFPDGMQKIGQWEDGRLLKWEEEAALAAAQTMQKGISAH